MEKGAKKKKTETGFRIFQYRDILISPPDPPQYSHVIVGSENSNTIGTWSWDKRPGA